MQKFGNPVRAVFHSGASGPLARRMPLASGAWKSGRAKFKDVFKEARLSEFRWACPRTLHPSGAS